MKVMNFRLRSGLLLLTGIFFLLTAGTLLSIPFKIFSLSRVEGSLPAMPKYSAFGVEELSAYTSPLKTHALFYIPEIRQAVVSQGPSVDQVLKQYRVIGIVQGAQPAAVIQDVPTKASHLVQPGENFDKIRLVEVDKSAIIVDYNGIRRSLPLQEAQP